MKSAHSITNALMVRRTINAFLRQRAIESKKNFVKET
jgi:hypothetical protein